MLSFIYVIHQINKTIYVSSTFLNRNNVKSLGLKIIFSLFRFNMNCNHALKNLTHSRVQDFYNILVRMTFVTS